MEALESRLRVDRICREFERQSLRSKTPPAIESYLERVTGPEHSQALKELLATELAIRIHAGETPTVAEYQDRFPAHRDSILAAFDDVAELDDSPRNTWPFQSSLGHYLLIREIGRGGMGVVFEAKHKSTGRRAAVKALLPDLQVGEHRLRGFEQEFQTISQLHHPNIVDVLERGQQAGVHFFAMRYVDGVNLEDVVANHDRSLTDAAGTETPSRRRYRRAVADLVSLGRYRRIAKIGVQIADALEYAHQQGVTHRDVKPSNILLDEIGKAWLTDFGLARHRGTSPLVSDSDGFAGTLRYLPPECLDGDPGPSGDVYSLGLVLYELLTLRPAHDASNHRRLWQQIVEIAPRRPRDVNPAVPEDLELIVLRAIARKPQQRYANAAELRRDLERFLKLESPQARQPWWQASWQAWRGTMQRMSTHWPIVAVAAVSMALLFASLQLARQYAASGNVPHRVSVPDAGQPVPHPVRDAKDI